MQHYSEFRWCSRYLILKIFFVSILLQYCLSIQMYDGEKRRCLIPLSRLGRARILSAVDENLAAGLLAYPHIDQRLWELTKTLIPYPRAGRLVFDPEDYSIFLNTDYASPESEDSSADVLKSNLHLLQKRPLLIPRIGRKKRSIPNDDKQNNQHTEEDEKDLSESVNDNDELENLDDSEADFLFADDKRGALNKSAFAPRIGKKGSNYLEKYLEDKRAAIFTPRIGRAAAFTPRIGRATAFTPRIGRAALIPRIGRTDPRFRLRSRSFFIPRIGRRAALIPRVGRSENS